MPLHTLQGKFVYCIVPSAERFCIEVSSRSNLIVHIAVFVLKLVVHILIYKGYSYSVGRRDYEEIENKAEEEDYRSGDKIGIEQPLEAYASCQNCNYLCIDLIPA